MKVGYLGFSSTWFQHLARHRDFEPVIAFCDRGRDSAELGRLCRELGIPLHLIAADSEMPGLIDDQPIDFFVIHQTSIIIHPPLLERFPFYNLHLGDLRTNRGAHSLTWSILMGDSRTALSLHQVTEKIDDGPLLAEYWVPVRPDDDTGSLLKRLENGYPYMLDRLLAHRKGLSPAQPPPGGLYRPKLQARHYTVDPVRDRPEQIRRKINSQRAYQPQRARPVKILVTGLCSLHWGRMEFGNIGNYYIVEPFFRELHRVFPVAEIATTLQMSENFQAREKIKTLPLDLFYNWRDDEVRLADRDCQQALSWARTQRRPADSPYLEAVGQSDLVVNLSGDMWGDNGAIAGPGRFQTALLRDRAAQLMGPPVVMMAGSPGPFDDPALLPLAREVYANFSYVSNREPCSTRALERMEFDLSKTRPSVCPSVLFQGHPNRELTERLRAFKGDRPLLAGLSLCGFSLPGGSYDSWPRPAQDFAPLARLLEYLINQHQAAVVMISHSNGFDLEPFRLKPGRDFPLHEHLARLLNSSGRIDPARLMLVREPLLPTEAKAAIGLVDFHIAGRAHSAVAAASQGRPVLLLDYLNGPSPLKMKGFAEQFGFDDFLSRADDFDDMKNKTERLIAHLRPLTEKLKTSQDAAAEEARAQFDILPTLIHRARS